MYDVVIIGAGVSGCATARELAKYEAKICVVERFEDVCCGTSKANSAIVHAGYDAQPGTLMARLDVEGSYRIPQLARDLDFPYRNNGSLVLCMDEEDLPLLQALYDRGRKTGCPPCGWSRGKRSSLWSPMSGRTWWQGWRPPPEASCVPLA